MTLTEAETNEAAERLAHTAMKFDWAKLSEHERQGFRYIVTNLAAELKGVPRTPEALAVFMAWMGDPTGKMPDAVKLLDRE